MSKVLKRIQLRQELNNSWMEISEMIIDVEAEIAVDNNTSDRVAKLRLLLGRLTRKQAVLEARQAALKNDPAIAPSHEEIQKTQELALALAEQNRASTITSAVIEASIIILKPASEAPAE